MGDTYRQQLFDVALDQYGYVTSADARELGIPVVELGKLAHRGRLDHVGYGLYRFPELPAGEYGHYLEATLWADRRGVLSHETVLALHRLADVNPAVIHLTVPAGYRPRRRGGQHYVIHHQDLKPDELAWFAGIRTVTPKTAIIQCLRGDTPTYLVRQAIETAADRGLVTRQAHEELTAELPEAVRG